MKHSVSILLFCLLYLQMIFSQQFTESNLPLILINTNGKEIPDEPKITALMKVINNPDGINKISDKTYEYNGYIGIEKRGNTSQLFYNKKSYSLETRTDTGTNLNVSLLGMPEENDWILYGPYGDKSLIRNVLAYHLGNSQGNWSPRTKYCEVFLNDEYRGVYVLTEKIKIDKNRVNIATLLPEDNEGDELTGGYILRVDRQQPGSWISPFKGWTGTSIVPISYFDPKYDELTKQQREYIMDYVTNFEFALDGNDFSDPEKGYRPFIDIVSFVDYFIMTELTRDLDGYRCSVYFHKDKDSNGGKLNMSPLWDYNLGFGMGDFMEADNPEGWVMEGIGSGDGYEPFFWYDRLRQDPYFEAYLKYRWEALRRNTFSKENINAFIDSCANLLDDAQKRNFQKFKILNQKVWPNSYVGGSYTNEINYLKSWISERLYWLDSQIDLIESSIVNIDNIKDTGYNYQVRVYPNPFTDKFTVYFNLSQNAKVETIVYNVLGEEILHRSEIIHQGDHEFIFTGKQLKQGGNIFLYTLIINGAKVKTGKITKR